MTDFMFTLELTLEVTFGTLFMVTAGKLVGTGIWKQTCSIFAGQQMDMTQK